MRLPASHTGTSVVFGPAVSLPAFKAEVAGSGTVHEEISELVFGDGPDVDFVLPWVRAAALEALSISTADTAGSLPEGRRLMVVWGGILAEPMHWSSLAVDLSRAATEGQKEEHEELYELRRNW